MCIFFHSSFFILTSAPVPHLFPGNGLTGHKLKQKWNKLVLLFMVNWKVVFSVCLWKHESNILVGSIVLAMITRQKKASSSTVKMKKLHVNVVEPVYIRNFVQ